MMRSKPWSSLAFRLALTAQNVPAVDRRRVHIALAWRALSALCCTEVASCCMPAADSSSAAAWVWVPRPARHPVPSSRLPKRKKRPAKPIKAVKPESKFS